MHVQSLIYVQTKHDELLLLLLLSITAKGRFSSSIGVMLSMLGSVVGTGNIWRFPRIMATHAEAGG